MFVLGLVIIEIYCKDTKQLENKQEISEEFYKSVTVFL